MSIDAFVIVWWIVIFVWAWVSLHRLRVNQGDWNPENWRRCQNCGGALVRLDPDNLAVHLGHRLGPARNILFNEYVRIVWGLL